MWLINYVEWTFNTQTCLRGTKNLKNSEIKRWDKRNKRKALWKSPCHHMVVGWITFQKTVLCSCPQAQVFRPTYSSGGLREEVVIDECFPRISSTYWNIFIFYSSSSGACMCLWGREMSLLGLLKSYATTLSSPSISETSFNFFTTLKLILGLAAKSDYFIKYSAWKITINSF